MKTAISVPDVVAERVGRQAARLGISRSEFFTKAAQRWLDDLDQDELTQAINHAVDQVDEDDNAAFLRAAATQVLSSDRG